jgi:GntR family transcriptional regulator/MocR family aminotransferase
MVLRTGPHLIVSTGPLLAVDLDRRRPLGRQLEQQLRALIASQGLPVGALLPSTRALATDLGVSRGVVVGAYAQLGAEGSIVLRRGAAPMVAAAPREPEPAPPFPDVAVAAMRFNLRPDLPDLALFPRAEWLAACRASLNRAANTDLAYGEPFGAIELRRRLAPFLARTRGLVATAERTGVCAGSTQGLFALATIVRELGGARIAVEDPGHRWRTRALAASGLEVVPVPVDEEGLRVDLLGDAAAIVVSPDHQFPLGAALSPGRRRALVEWATRGDRLVIEHDYDGWLRYDRNPPAALQSLAPEHVVYVGSASSMLVPTLRLGWAVLPARLVVPFANHVFAHGIATPRLTQLALAELIARGYLERHLRRVRAAYRRRREHACAALARLPREARIVGVPAGLFVAVSLLDDTAEESLLALARERGIAVDGVGEHALIPQPPGLAVGFAALPEPTLERAIRELIRCFP